MSFHRGASLRRMCLVAVGVLIGTSPLTQPRAAQEATPPAAEEAGEGE